MLYSSAINTEFTLATPETKFFIIKLLEAYPKLDGVILPIGKISVEFGMTDKSVSKAINYLLEYDYLKLDCENITRGKPKRKFTITKTLLNKIGSKAVNPKENIKVLIDDLLLPDIISKFKIKNELGLNNEDRIPFQHTKKIAKLKKHPLTISNRLLLLTLLLNSDYKGRVKNLSLTDLIKLSCMSNARLKSQLNKLKEHLYIINVVRGVNAKYIFGKKPSIYFLDLFHKNFKSSKANKYKRNDYIIISHVESTIAELTYHSAQELMDRYKYRGLTGKLIKDSLDNKPSSYQREMIKVEKLMLIPLSATIFCEIINFFKDKYSEPLIIMLQAHIEEYAEKIHQETEIDLIKKEALKSSIIQCVKVDFFDRISLGQRESSVGFPSELQISLFCAYIYELSCFFAERIPKDKPLDTKKAFIYSKYE